MCTTTYNEPTTILTISNAACLDTRALSEGGREREASLAQLPETREAVCYADEKLLALFPDGIGSASELLKLLVIY